MNSAHGFVGVPDVLSYSAASELAGALRSLWVAQVGAEPTTLREDLERLKEWFDPVASGDRLRRTLASAPPEKHEWQFRAPLVYSTAGRVLITPEGRAALFVLADALDRQTGNAATSNVVPEQVLVNDVVNELADLYRSWSRQRLDGVAHLLGHETETLRPGAAGLLLVLLINRNTSAGRALPRSRIAAQRSPIEEAIREPALAWATAFTGKRASGVGIDLYRGWAIGELSRRLGSAFHLDFGDEGVYIEEDAVPSAIDRLVEDLAKRPARLRRRIPASWHALTDEYRRSRPRLTSLRLAFERPSFTQELERTLLAHTPASDHEPENSPNGA